MFIDNLKYFVWTLKGKPVPAEGSIKRIILKDYAQKYKLNYFVETGTFNGDTVNALESHFRQLHSIELSKELYTRAKKRFEYSKKVTIWQGDSGKTLKKILPLLNKPALFWLDAHGSGGITAEGEEWSPIIKELLLITKLSNKKHVILIDDARGFTGNLSPTISQIEKVIQENHPNYKFEVVDDIIRIILK
jgi:hypothetical protein